MNDQMQLPPEGRLTDQQKAVMRADLLAATDEAVRRPGRRWVVPLGTAAAVALLVGGAIVLQSGGERSGTTGVPVADTSTSAAPAESTDVATPQPTGYGTGAKCAEAALEVATNDQVAIQGNLTIDTLVGYQGGTTYLLRAGDKWVLCDDWLAYGKPTVLAWHGNGTTSVTKKAFQYSTNNSANGETEFVAGGAALPDVTAVSYAFPTGDVVDAEVNDHMWQMVFITKLKTFDPFLTDPVVVTVTHTDGSTQRFELGPEDMCAQRSHGC